jgi:hypothetical protein
MNEAPEKIYGWLDTQLSIARHYGGMKFRGANYVIDFSDPDQPLVRQDIFQGEKKNAKELKKTNVEKQKSWMDDLFLGGPVP